MKMKVVFAAIIVALFVSSCANHFGMLSSNAVVVNDQFRVVGLGIGESETTKIFGIGGLNKSALVYEAKKDLYKNINLEKGQALTNISVDFKRTDLLVYSKTKVYVTAEIVDFSGDDKEQGNDYKVQERRGFSLGESVCLLEKAN